MKKIFIFTLLMLLSLHVFGQNDMEQWRVKMPTEQSKARKHKVKGVSNGKIPENIESIRRDGETAVTPPEGIEPEVWEYQSGTFMMTAIGGGWQEYTKKATKEFEVVIDNNDVYIKGLAFFVKRAWVKGTINGNQLIIPTGQYLGTTILGSIYLNGIDFNDEGEDKTPVDIIFEYDAELKKLTLNENIGIIECESSTELAGFCYWYDLVIQKPDPSELLPITPPEGLVTTEKTLTGKSGIGNTYINKNVMIGIDGTDVYILGLVNDFPNEWVKGTIADNTVTFPIRYIGSVEEQKYFIAGLASGSLVPYSMTYDQERGTYEYDSQLLVNNNKFNYNNESLLNSYSGLYIGQRPEPLSPPENLQTKKVEYTGKDAKGLTVNGSINIGYDGNNVWMQGLYNGLPEGWTMGTFNEERTELTIELGQFIGEDENGAYNIYVVGDDRSNPDNVLITDVKLNYNAENDVFESVNNMFFNIKKDRLLFINALRAGLIIGEVADHTWIAKEQGYSDNQEITEITIAEGIKGTLSKNDGENSPKYNETGDAVNMFAANSLTITSEKEIAKIVITMTGSEDEMTLESNIPKYSKNDNVGIWKGESNKVVFSVPNESGKQAKIQRIDIFLLDYSNSVVTAPEDLVTEDYYFKATDTYHHSTVTNVVKVGFYGEEDVYIQGLSQYIRKAWVKGKLNEGKLVIPRRKLGESSSIFGVFVLEFCGAEFTYDSENGIFFSAEGFNTIDKEDEFEMDEFENVTLTKIVEKAITPAKPAITSYSQGNKYDHVNMIIPLEDVEGKPLVADKLSYKLYYSIGDEVKEIEFTTDLYGKLEENMTEIPYNFTDGHDIEVNGQRINLYHGNRTEWERIGVVSIYRGGGETNESSIYWYKLKDTVNIEEAAIANGEENFDIYNLQGIRMKTAPKGIYIKNGKKYVVR